MLLRRLIPVSSLPLSSSIANKFNPSSSFQIVNFEEEENRYQLTQLSLYYSKNQLAFYDKKWREKLSALKPTGLLTLLLSRGNKNMV